MSRFAILSAHGLTSICFRDTFSDLEFGNLDLNMISQKKGIIQTLLLESTGKFFVSLKTPSVPQQILNSEEYFPQRKNYHVLKFLEYFRAFSNREE